MIYDPTEHSRVTALSKATSDLMEQVKFVAGYSQKEVEEQLTGFNAAIEDAVHDYLSCAVQRVEDAAAEELSYSSRDVGYAHGP